jgi:predicted DNA-binding transcriptional regulator AlpA
VHIDSRTELVIAADIAERLGISRARVSVLVGRSDFPRPVGRLGRSDVWRWASVERWARETGRLSRTPE